MLQWAQGCIYLLELLFFFSLDIYWGVELLNHMVLLFLIFWGIPPILFSIVAAPIYILSNSVWELFSPYPCQHLVLGVSLIIAILTGVRWYLTVLLIYISLIISECEHLFLCPLAPVCLLCKEVYSDPSPTFESCVFLMLSCITSLCILDILNPSQTDCKYPLLFSRWPFCFIDSFLHRTRAF